MFFVLEPVSRGLFHTQSEINSSVDSTGFIRERQGRIMEDVVEEYLIELIQRSLVQVANVSFNGQVRECRVHDLMREMIVLRSRELNFHQVPVENYHILKGRIPTTTL